MTATGPFVDEDAVKFNATMKDFEDKTGIAIEYTGHQAVRGGHLGRVEANNAPDIADFPQPGLLANFAKAGKVIDLPKHARHGRPQGQVQPELAGHGDHARRQRRRSWPASGSG